MRRFLVFLIILLTVVAIYNGHTFVRECTDYYHYIEGNTYYRFWRYSEAEKRYESIKTPDRELSFRIGHNLGNTLYRLGEETTGSGRTLAWGLSLVSYERALKIREDSETRANHDFIAKKLAKEQETQKKQEEEKKKSEEQDKKQAEHPQTSGSGSEKQSDSQSGKTWTNQGSYSSLRGQTGSGEDRTPLTPQETQELQNYQQSLQDFQKQNGRLLNLDSDKKTSPTDQMNAIFGGDPFFRDAIPSGSGKKDW